MSIAKKSSRLITVDGNVFRWVFNPRKDQVHGTISIQIEEKNGCKLIVKLPNWKDPWFDWNREHPNYPEKITPSFIERTIKSSLNLGWNYQGTGSFHVIYNAEIDDFEK